MRNVFEEAPLTASNGMDQFEERLESETQLRSSGTGQASGGGVMTVRIERARQVSEASPQRKRDRQGLQACGRLIWKCCQAFGFVFFFFFLPVTLHFHVLEHKAGLQRLCSYKYNQYSDPPGSKRKTPSGTYNLWHSGFVTRGMALCDASQTAALSCIMGHVNT